MENDKNNQRMLSFGVILETDVNREPNLTGTDVNRAEESTSVFCIVFSDRRILPVLDTLKLGEGVLLEQFPVMSKYFFTRWSPRSVQKFINNDVDIDLKAVFKSVRERFEYYIDFPEKEWYDAVSLWVVGTYLYPMFQAYPYIFLFGMPSSGKTKTMQVAKNLSFNGQISVGITPAALYRGTHALGWSLFFDEARLFRTRQHGELSPRAEEILPLINEGYKQGAVVPRTGTKESGFTLDFFKVYCPKMFSSNDPVNEILNTRFIEIVMRPALKNIPQSEREVNDMSGEWQILRDALYTGAMLHFDKVADMYDGLQNTTQVANRDWELWKPLLSMAKVIDEELFVSLCLFAEKVTKIKVEEQLVSADFLLFDALFGLDIWNSWISATEITQKCQDIFMSRENISFAPQWISNRWIGTRIKKLSIPHDTKKPQNKACYMFSKDSLQATAARYGYIYRDAEVDEKDNKSQTSFKDIGIL